MRSYDPNAGQWTTPDAYAGDVHDPMTQKPFMWNRNNPYVYSDPTGYDWQEAGRSSIELLLRIAASPFFGSLLGIGVASARSTGDGGYAEKGGVRYNISSNGLSHTRDNHMQGGKASAGKSLFSAGTTKEDVTKMVQNAVLHGSQQEQSGQGTYKSFTIDVGHTIGTDINGNASSGLKAVFDGNNELKSAYPVAQTTVTAGSK